MTTMIITAHQPNFLPGMSVIEKIRQSDAVIWLDEVQYSHGGWSNRNKMPDGSYLTVPVDRKTDMGQFNRVRISAHKDWRETQVRTLYQHFGSPVMPLATQIARPFGLLIGLNLALLKIILKDSDAEWHFQSHLDGGRAVPATGDAEAVKPISLRLAKMVAELGGTTYLSGPSGFRYLDETPFHEHGIQVEYFNWSDSNPCCVEQYAACR